MTGQEGDSFHSIIDFGYVSIWFSEIERNVTIVEDEEVNSDGEVSVGINRSGIYTVKCNAEGFIDTELQFDLDLDLNPWFIRKYVYMTPELEDGQKKV